MAETNTNIRTKTHLQAAVNGGISFEDLRKAFDDACDRLEQLGEALNPVREWYGGETEGERSDVEILIDAITDLQTDRAKVLKQAAEIKQHRWIPVSERLPTLKDACEGQDQRCRDGTVDVIGVDVNGFVFGANYYPKMKVWNFNTDPTHWKPIILPEQALKDPK